MKLRWSHAVIYVRDLETMVDFYRNVLGFEVSDRGPLDPADPEGLQIVFMSQVGSDHHQIAFLPLRQEGMKTVFDHIAFRVDSLADVKEMARKLEADGRATAIRPLTHGNAWSVYFSDPEGNGLEVFCDSPFAVQQPQIRPWDLTMSDDELRRTTEKEFASEPGFGSMDEYYAERRRRFGD